MKARTKRIIYTLLMPPALMALAVALSALARLLEQTAGGKALMLVALAAVAVKLGHMAWTWPGWTDDERKAEICQRSGAFKRGDMVRKVRGSQWQGRVVGEYSTTLTPEGYAVESDTHAGSVQIYPAAALELVERR